MISVNPQAQTNFIDEVTVYKKLVQKKDGICKVLIQNEERHERLFQNIFDFSDDHHQCMKTIIESYEMKTVTNNENPRGFYINGLQATFYLKDLSKISLKLMDGDKEFEDRVSCDVNSKNDRQLDEKIDKELIMTSCAAKSILKSLYDTGCTCKTSFTFQARQGGHVTKNLEVSDIVNILLKKDAIKFNYRDFRTWNFREDTVSHSYAYLSERKICVFFNDLTSEQQEKIQAVLSQLLPVKSTS